MKIISLLAKILLSPNLMKIITKQSDLINNYHIVQNGENLTEISNKYNLKVKSI